MVKKISSPFHYYYDDPGYTFGNFKGGWGDISNPFSPWADFRIIDPYDPNKTIPYSPSIEKWAPGEAWSEDIPHAGLFADPDLESQVSDQLPRHLVTTKEFPIDMLQQLKVEPLSLPFDPYPKDEVNPPIYSDLKESKVSPKTVGGFIKNNQVREKPFETLLESAEPWEKFSPRPPSTGVKQDDVFDSSRLFSRDIFNTRPGYFHALNDSSESMGTRIAAMAMPFATAATPFGGPLALVGGGLHAMGAYNPLNPQTTDSNIEYDPNRGKISYSTTSPGGYGLQYGDLSNMNTLADMARKNPSAMVRMEGLPEGQNYAYAGELANYLQNQREFGPFDDYIQMPITDLAGAPSYQYETFADGVTNQEALSNYAANNAGPILNQAAELLGPDAGYNETRELADSIAGSMQSQIDNQYGGGGFDIGGGITGGFGETYDPGEDFAAAYGDWL